MRLATTTTFFTLVTVDDEILPGYSASTIPRLGMDVGGGLHVGVYVTAGQSAQPNIHFEFSIRHNNDLYVFLSLHVPVAALLSDITMGQCRSDNRLTLAPLRTSTPKDLDVLSQYSRDNKYAEKLKDAGLSDPVAPLDMVTLDSQLLPHGSRLLPHLRGPQRGLLQDFGDRPPVAQEIVTEVMARLHSAPKFALTCWFFVESSFAKHWQGMLPRIRNLPPPFAHFLTNVRTNYTDLTYNNLGAVEEEFRPKRPVPAATVFRSAEHRTVTLIAGAAEEQQMVDQNALELIGTLMQTIFVNDIFSAWSPMPDDLDVYGMRADGFLTQY
ncbi:uncharacterized protein NECHADRAFT_79052 [Fusarium vanettenii 77-13-4]|uniref:Uncharacterized protein n=1 Tax=Fusarium vanettenii (strain ATCC MYA-4622 / CBS 123669 / FGSC 9596 / NRRL 45880 / 77-13-4) TaxID=660122 RepID=C7YQC0_FUSV7|nr:uncharacterized protein NECHADRAFT_79052 [Fusarium vanettenii 77-13-4]EEU46442.1 hypothetical protein NECHADRAFT_79052 [Fusarium vanettenii 77-13-4]